MNAFGMPMVMDPRDQASGSRSRSQANIFRADRESSDNQLTPQPSVFQASAVHPRNFGLRMNQHQRPAGEGLFGTRHSDTVLYQPPPPQNNSNLETHPESQPTQADHAHSTYHQYEAEYGNATLSMDMDLRFRGAGDISSIGGIQSLDSIDMDMGMDMDNMPLLPAGGSLHDVEQFIAGWHDQ